MTTPTWNKANVEAQATSIRAYYNAYFSANPPDGTDPNYIGLCNALQTGALMLADHFGGTAIQFGGGPKG